MQQAVDSSQTAQHAEWEVSSGRWAMGGVRTPTLLTRAEIAVASPLDVRKGSAFPWYQ